MSSTNPLKGIGLQESRSGSDAELGVRKAQVARHVDDAVHSDCVVDQLLEGYVKSLVAVFAVGVRALGLHDLAGGDVEAPTQEQTVSDLGEGTWRVGAPDAPERLRASPAPEGEVVMVQRDNCPYSRVFTP